MRYMNFGYILEKYLPRLAKGEAVCSFALTEPDAGG